MFPALTDHLQHLAAQPIQLSEARLRTLDKLVAHILQKRQEKQPIALNFICTHNSRRSHLAQAWAAAWSKFYQIDQFNVYSGGTEATAFHPNSIKALQEVGFEIGLLATGANPRYILKTGPEEPGMVMFSKKFDAPENPESHFVAILVCSDADEACPFVPGCELRIALPFEDPKISDGTAQEAATYLTKSQEIAVELGYVLREVANV
jgi:arsenate reductase